MELNEVRIFKENDYWVIQSVFEVGGQMKYTNIQRETEPTVDDAVGLVAEAIKQLGKQPNG